MKPRESNTFFGKKAATTGVRVTISDAVGSPLHAKNKQIIMIKNRGVLTVFVCDAPHLRTLLPHLTGDFESIQKAA